MKNIEEKLMLIGLVLITGAAIGLALIDNSYRNECYCSSIDNNFKI